MKIIIDAKEVHEYGTYYSNSEHLELKLEEHNDEKILLTIREMKILISKSELEKILKVLSY